MTVTDWEPAEVPAWIKWATVDATAEAMRELCSMLAIPDDAADEVALEAMLIAAAAMQFSRLDLS